MKLIIDIDEETYKRICKVQSTFDLWDLYGEKVVCAISSIRKGIPYEERPKGDLISREALKQAIENYLAKRQDVIIWETDMFDMLDNAPTVSHKLSDEQIEKITDLLEIEWGYEGIREDISRILRGKEK